LSEHRPLASSEEVAAYLQLPSKRTLDTWARAKTGPRFAKVGRHRRYRWEDVDRWIDEQSMAAA
jgi:excisionase family DNA binding protein